MEHFWSTIEGNFTFSDLYSWIARQARLGWHGVELGVYKGQSAAFMGVELMRYAAYCPKFDLVSYFYECDATADQVRRTLAPVASVIGEIHAGNSWEMAERYADKSLDFVFIDADHDYESVSKDIDAWKPKVKRGGILAGHDFTPVLPGVIQAVLERFPRFDIWRGSNTSTDANMNGRYWPCWAVVNP